MIPRDYEIEVRTVDRTVISAHNLMMWVTSSHEQLMIKICRLTAAHDWLASRAVLVGWLADRDQPVTRPLVSVDGHRQLLGTIIPSGSNRYWLEACSTRPIPVRSRQPVTP